MGSDDEHGRAGTFKIKIKVSDEHGQPGAGIHAKSRRVRSHDELMGLCKGVIADGQVNEAEARFLVTWFSANPEAAEAWPGKQLAARLAAVWEDGTATPEELDDLKELMQELTGLSTQALADLPRNLTTQLPLDKPAPKVVFKDRSFCFTGKMVCGPRAACENMVTERWGRVAARPSGELDYLVVGLLGSRDWLHSNYGNKILAAVEYKEKGRPVKIISEDTWLRGIEAFDKEHPVRLLRNEKHPPQAAPGSQAEILRLLKELTPEWSEAVRPRRSRIPLVQFPYSTEGGQTDLAINQPGLALNWRIPLDRCFMDEIDYKLTAGNVTKIESTYKSRPKITEITHFYWTQGSNFCFERGDVIWLDRGDLLVPGSTGYQSGIGHALQIKSATPAISAYSEIVQRWPAWPENLPDLIKEIEDNGDRALKKEIPQAKPDEVCQLRRLKKRIPGSIKAEIYQARDGRNVKTGEISMTQDELVRGLITGEGLV